MDIRKALLKPTLKSEQVYLPGIGAEVTVQEMNAERLDIYESLIYQVDDDGQVAVNTDHLKAKIAVCSVVDDKGELIFKPEDVEALSQSYGKDLKLISEVGGRLSGIIKASEIEKN